MKSTIERLSTISNYLLIVSDAETIYGQKVSAESIAIERIRLGKWPIFEKTPYRGKFSIGDRFVVYIGGRSVKTRSFIGYFRANEIIPANSRAQSVDAETLAVKSPHLILTYRDFTWLNPSVAIEDLRRSISIFGRHPKWGIYLQGGCKRISDSDFEIISKHNQKR